VGDPNQVRLFPSSVSPELRKRCAKSWEAGEFETAVFNALKVLERHIADAIGESQLIGVKLVDTALAPGSGKLKLKDQPAEQEGLHQTVRGLFLLLRNPSAHRFVDYLPEEAEAIIPFVDFLLVSFNQAVASYDDQLDFKQGFSHYVIADADGDGQLEKIVVVGKEPYPSMKSELHILKQTGAGLQRYQLLQDFLEFSVFSIEVRDINQDLMREVLVSTPGGAHAESMYVFRWDGTGYRLVGDFWSYAPRIEVIDLDGDGVCEVRTFCRNHEKDPLKAIFYILDGFPSIRVSDNEWTAIPPLDAFHFLATPVK